MTQSPVFAANSKILALCHSDVQAGHYAVFRADGSLNVCGRDLFHGDSPAPLIAKLRNIDCAAKEISLLFKHPYICVWERFGTNAAAVCVEDGSVREFSRGDYHEDLTSYSMAFIARPEGLCLLHQTEWNRLDITELRTGKCLTEREVSCTEIAKGHNDESGKWINPKYEYVNYSDYFHSLLHVSPNGEHFISNGWVWQPADTITVYRMADFLTVYEPSMIGVDNRFSTGYNWDRPCAFIDNDIFVVAGDNYDDSSDETGETAGGCAALLYYKIQDTQEVTKRYTLSGEEHSVSYRIIEPFRTVPCGVFATGTDGQHNEAKGQLYHDPHSDRLIGLTHKGAYLLKPDGTVLRRAPNDPAADGSADGAETACFEWHYSEQFQLIYRLTSGAAFFEEMPLTEIPHTA